MIYFDCMGFIDYDWSGLLGLDRLGLIWMCLIDLNGIVKIFIFLGGFKWILIDMVRFQIG